MTTERRSHVGAELRAVDGPDGEHWVDLRVVRYHVVDTYGSVWAPGVFGASFEQRKPTLAWSHDWTDLLGRAVDYQDGQDGPTIRFRLDDFGAVPRAAQAYAQVRSGTIDDCSVGFSNAFRRDPTEEERGRWPGVVEVIERADLDEVSLVMRGAVPGAKVLAVRSAAGAQIGVAVAAEVMARLGSGVIDLHEALGAIKAAAVADTPTPAVAAPQPAAETPPAEPDPEEPDEPSEPEEPFVADPDQLAAAAAIVDSL